MSYDFEAQADAHEALRPIAQGGFGQALTLRRVTGSTRDNATLKRTPSTADDEGSGIELSEKPREIGGTRVLGTDLVFLLSPLTTAGVVLPSPKPGTLVLSGATVLGRVEAVETFSPAGNPVLHTVLVRGQA